MAKASALFHQAEDVIKSLKKDGRIFVSEAHFQLSFAMRAKDPFSAYEYIPEYSVEEIEKRSEFDLLIRNPDGGSGTLIEFKYKLTNQSGKSPVSFPIYGNSPHVPPFWPKADGTVDLIRYDCWKDIARIERFVKPKDTDHEKYRISNGFFILITNNQNLWDEKPGKTGMLSPYSLSNGPHPAKTLYGFGYDQDGNELSKKNNQSGMFGPARSYHHHE